MMSQEAAAGPPDVLERSAVPTYSTDRSVAPLVHRLRALALDRLGSMYRPEEGLFIFRVQRENGRMRPAGLSPRYTGIALIGLAREDPDVVARVLGGEAATTVCTRLLERTSAAGNLGDLALAYWAANLLGAGARVAGRRHLCSANPQDRRCTIVELSWALAALCADRSPEVHDLRRQVASRLMQHFDHRSNCFPHETGGRFGIRSHVACFADLIYPVLALAHYAEVAGDDRAARLSALTARHVCDLQGAAGQWWWHYDIRNGSVVERYPVYSVHQHAMAPMALLAIQRVSGESFAQPIAAGLRWLLDAPELEGGSLMDDAAGTVWRKVGRREPHKTSRFVHAVATRIRQRSRCPGLDRMFPPVAIDHEFRPYELGWLLYAWPAGAVQ